jgi:DNA polymerase I-like protein with 3'-5' exonuclease and polymerase domains
MLLYIPIEMNQWIKKVNMPARIFALVHDSILAEVPDEHVEEYCGKLQECVQKDRGVNIPNAPIGCDFEVGEDYSMGKFVAKYEV